MTKLFHKNKNKAEKLNSPFFNIYKRRTSIINNFIETKSDYHITKLDTIHDKFYKILFEQIVSCSLIDTEDFFSDHNQTSDILFRNMHTLEASSLEAFEKHMIMYHIIKIVQSNPCEINAAEVNKITLAKFDLKSSDKDRYRKYISWSKNMSDKFEHLFASEISLNVFDVNNISTDLSIYISNFLTQCHKSFMASYTTYIDIDTKTNLLKVKA